MLARITLIAALVGSVVIASAQTTLTLNGLTDYSQTININDQQLANPGWIDVYASPENATLDLNGKKENLVVFCDDTAHYSVDGVTDPVTIEYTNTMGANYQKAAQYYNYLEPSIRGNVMDEAALQLTIWNTIYGTQFSGNTALENLANTYLATDVSKASDVAINYDFHGQNQSMLGGVQAVPEPCSMITLGAGALTLLRRRKKAQASQA